MTPTPTPVSRRVAGALRDAQDDFLERSTATDEVAARLAAGAPAPERGARRARAALGLGVLAAAAAGLLWIALGGDDGAPVARLTPLTWEVDGSPAARVAAPAAGASSTLRFSDGTAFEVAPDGRLRVIDVAPGEVRLALEAGALEADVVSAHARAWRVEAGALEVRVTGTRFTLRRDADGGLDVRTTEGRVEVRGPCLDGAVAVTAGQREHLRCAVEASDAPAGPGDMAAGDTAGSDSAADVTAARGSAAAGTATDRTTTDRTTTDRTATGHTTTGRAATDEIATENTAASDRAADDTAARGAAAEDSATGARSVADGTSPRVGGARGSGRRGEAAGPSAEELLSAARAAEGQPVEQARRLEGLRAAYPDAPQARLATFLLGRLALSEGEPREAVRRFDEYLAGRSTGTLAREARGLRLEALRAAGDGERARQSARAYLRLYPDGPHARFALELLAP